MASGLNPSHELQTLRLDEYGSLLVSWGPPPEMPYLVSAFGCRAITMNTVGQPVTASPDPSLSSDAGYVLITAGWGEVPGGLNHLVGQGPSGELIIQRTGVYRVDMWSTVSASANTILGFKHSLNGVLNSGRVPVARIAGAGGVEAVTSCAAHGFRHYQAGDSLQMYVASRATVTVTIQDMLFTVQELLTGGIGP